MEHGYSSKYGIRNLINYHTYKFSLHVTILSQIYPEQRHKFYCITVNTNIHLPLLVSVHSSSFVRVFPSTPLHISSLRRFR
jgi:hypothetical protein